MARYSSALNIFGAFAAAWWWEWCLGYTPLEAEEEEEEGAEMESERWDWNSSSVRLRRS